MKRLLVLYMTAVVSALACSEAGMPSDGMLPEPLGELSIDVNLEGAGETKTAYIAETASEKKMSEIQLLIFHDDGTLAYYRNLGTETSLEGISLTRGEKKVWAVANAMDLSSVKNLSALTSRDIELSAYNDPGTDFVMAGSNTVDVGTQSSVGIVMSRFVSRIVLNRVTNALPAAAGALVVENVFLSNVVGNQTLASGSDKPAVWYNQMGRQTGSGSSSAIIDGKNYKATAQELTFKSLGISVEKGASLSGTPCLLYTYPNDAVAGTVGWSVPFTPRKTRLVVTASFGGERYYYPVIVGPTLRNNTYSVEMTITGPGSKDPDKPVEKDSFKVTITPQSWQGTTEYTEII